MENKEIGIVTVLYNSESVLEDFFRTLNKQTYKNFILYLVDNNSTDMSVQRGKEYASKVDFECKWLLQEENLGVAEGNNIGIKAALADGCNYILLSNNDIVLQDNTIEMLLDGMLSMNASMAVPKIYYWNDPKRIWMAGGGFLWLQFTTYHRGENELDSDLYDQQLEIEYAPTCFMLIEASLFSKIGFMNDLYFVYYDDTDFIWRAVKLQRYKLVYIPSARIQHKVSSCTGGSLSDFSIFYSKRNHLYFALKYCNGIHFIAFLIYRIIHFVLKDIFVYNRKQLILIIKAYTQGLKLYKREKRSNR